MGNLVVFGVSNVLGTTIDWALAMGHSISRVVVNQPEVVRPRTKGMQERLQQLAQVAQPVQLLDIDSFEPPDR